MKKNNFLLTFIMVSCFLIANHNILGQCKSKQIVKGCKSNITKPYKYNSYAISEFEFNDKTQQIEVQFTAFQGQKYRIVFCSSGFEEEVKLNIFDKSKRVKTGRTKLYDNAQGIDNNFWVFEPPKSGNYYIEYDVPKSTNGQVKKGCVVMLIGYIEKEEN